jgi:hypothetical protein
MIASGIAANTQNVVLMRDGGSEGDHDNSNYSSPLTTSAHQALQSRPPVPSDPQAYAKCETTTVSCSRASPALTKMRDIPAPVTGIRRVQSLPAICPVGGALLEGKKTAVGADAMDIASLRSKLMNLPIKRKHVPFNAEVGAQFGIRIVDAVNDAGVCVLISVAHQLGLFAAMAKINDHPHSVSTIAAAANNLRPRYVQELLFALTCIGIVEETKHCAPQKKTATLLSPQSVGAVARNWLPHTHNTTTPSTQTESGPSAGNTAGNATALFNGSGADGNGNPLTATANGRLTVLKYRLPAEHALHLTWGQGPDNLALLMQYIPVLARLEDDVVECFRSGKGLDWTRYGQFDLVSELDTSQTIGAIEVFEAHVLALAPGLPDALRAGTSILCLGSGVGSTIAAIARAYPKSWFTVYETNGQKAKAAEAMHDTIPNLHFAALPALRSAAATAATADSTASAAEWPAMQENRTYAGALVLDGSVIRDAADPASLLARVHAALRGGCALVLLEYVTGGGAAAPLLHGLSAMQSVPLGLAAGGPALGRGWGADGAKAALLDAGFADVAIHIREGDDVNVVLVATAQSDN